MPGFADSAQRVQIADSIPALARRLFDIELIERIGLHRFVAAPGNRAMGDRQPFPM
jgi:hypothetical protein